MGYDEQRRRAREMREHARAQRERLQAEREGRLGDEWLTREQAASYGRVSLSTIDRAVRAGELKSSQPRPRVRRFRRRWLDTWLASGSVYLAYLLMVAFALALVCYCHAMHVNHGTHCIWF